MNDLQSILNQIGAILKGYERAIKSSSDNFNVFKILNLQTDEVNLHSLLIGELLNPHGSHNKGNTFLKCFVDVTKKELNEIFNIDKASLTVEKFIGPISPNKERGGRIDILLEDDQNNCIIIENKIYAGDQDKQLLRYYNYKGGRNGVIFYLTLNGKKPSPVSYSPLTIGQDFELISYNKTIVEWLEKCHQIASDSPFVRETIKQYINLIKLFSGQTIFKEMYEDIKTTIISNHQNFENAFQIASDFPQIKSELLLSFWSEVKEQLEVYLGTDYKVHLKAGTLKWEDVNPGIWIKHKDYGEDNVCQFALEPLNGRSGWSDGKLFYGIWVYGDSPAVKKNIEELLSLFDRQSQQWKWWLTIQKFDDLKFSSKETLKLILPNSNSRSELMHRIVSAFGGYVLKNNELIKQARGVIYK